MKILSAVILLAAGFLGMVATAPASAQIAQDGNFYEEVKSFTCGGGGSCQLEFSAVPQLILFSKINCFISVQGATLSATSFSIRDVSGGTPRRRELLPVPLGIDRGGGVSWYFFTVPTDFMVSAARFPLITSTFSGSAVGSLIECKITARLQ
jgi:hypothetical protein